MPPKSEPFTNIHIYNSLRAAYYYDAKVQKDRESNSCNCNIDSEWCMEFGALRLGSSVATVTVTAPITQLNSIPWMIEL